MKNKEEVIQILAGKYSIEYRRKVFDEYINNLLECVEDIIRCPASTNDGINMFLKLKDEIEDNRVKMKKCVDGVWNEK